MRGRAFIVTFAVSAVVLPAGLSAAAPAGDGPGTGTAPPAASSRGVDSDGDRVADDFESRLQSAGAQERLSVIVSGFGSARARQAVGSILLEQELPIIDGFAATMSGAQARALLRVPSLRRIEADGVVHALDDAGNADFGAAAARSDHPDVDGSGVGICVIDTGIDAAHEQIAPRTVTFTDYVNGRTTPYDDHGHGTHVASIAAGDGTAANGSSSGNAGLFGGVAPAATLYGAKVLDSSGSGTDSNVIAAIGWCHAQEPSAGGALPGVSVISMSLGGGTQGVTDAVNNAVAAGEVAVVAAGNSGDWPGTIDAPGVAAGAITVGAVSDYSAPAGTARHDDGIYVAGFSSRGPVGNAIKPDVTAPGVRVTAAKAGTTSDYVTMNGTSMATPYVSGAVALALEANPGMTPQAVKTALTGSAEDVGATGPDNEWGAGLVDVRALVDTVLGSPTPRQTAFPSHERRSGSVRDGGSTSFPISVTDTGAPLAITLVIRDSGQCDASINCWLFGEWAPDLDMELIDPAGRVVAVSRCMLEGLSCPQTGSPGGRQETIGIRPGTGDYILRVYDGGEGTGGAFDIDISRGPLAGGSGGGSTPPPGGDVNQPPVADTSATSTTVTITKGRTGSIKLDGSRSTDPEGQSLRYRWVEPMNSSWSATTVTATVKKPPGTYTFELTVSDPGGLSDTATVTVRVAK